VSVGCDHVRVPDTSTPRKNGTQTQNCHCNNAEHDVFNQWILDVFSHVLGKPIEFMLGFSVSTRNLTTIYHYIIIYHIRWPSKPSKPPVLRTFFPPFQPTESPPCRSRRRTRTCSYANWTLQCLADSLTPAVFLAHKTPWIGFWWKNIGNPMCLSNRRVSSEYSPTGMPLDLWSMAGKMLIFKMFFHTAI
jgi:hypothetical protein